MNKSAKKNLIFAAVFYGLFLLFTTLLLTVDVQPIGPVNSDVGFATVNAAVFEVFGDNPIWYTVSEVLGVVALLVAGGFAVLGFWQWISRKSLKKVDMDLFLLAGLYVAMGIFYVLFEVIVINYRPVLVLGDPEASYPSSHTMLVCVILSSAVFQVYRRIKNPKWQVGLTLGCITGIVLTALGRVFSGMHWITDVIAAVLLSCALVYTYFGVVDIFAPVRRGRRGRNG